MPFFQTRRSLVIIVLRDYFQFLCALAIFLSLWAVSDCKTVHPSQRSKFSEFQTNLSDDFLIIKDLKLTRQVPPQSYQSAALFLIPKNFFFPVISKNPDFFFKYLTISSMPSKITQSNLPHNSWQGLNSPYTLPKSIFSDNTAIMMGNHCLFLHFSILFQSNSPDLRILYLTPPSQANYISSTPMHISNECQSDATSSIKRKIPATEAHQPEHGAYNSDVLPSIPRITFFIYL